MHIIKSQHYNFNKYKEEMESITKMNPREHNYQALISDVLNKILINTDIDVIDPSNNYKSTKIHDHTHYTGPKGPPDLILARNFKYNNQEKDHAEYIAAIEVKRPDHSDLGKQIMKHEEQLISHLSKIHKLIFTDGIFWCFFTYKNQSKFKRLKPEKTFQLKDDSNQWKTGKIELSPFVSELLEINQSEQKTTPKEWFDLENYLYEFVTNNLGTSQH